MDCKPDMWKCNDGVTCIHKIYVCDINHKAHCIDRSDELATLCLNWTCSPGYWKCRDKTTCILERYILNGNSECKDGSDEQIEYHVKLHCPEEHQMCNNRAQCINFKDRPLQTIVLSIGCTII